MICVHVGILHLHAIVCCTHDVAQGDLFKSYQLLNNCHTHTVQYSLFECYVDDAIFLSLIIQWLNSLYICTDLCQRLGILVPGP